MMAATPVGRRLRDSVPGVEVFLIHGTPPDAIDRLERFVLRTGPDRFVSLSAAKEALDTDGQVRYALTFDDGFRSNRAVAERLAAFGVPACFFVCTGVVGANQDQVDRFFGRAQPEGVLGWDDLEDMVAMGHEVGSHAVNHRPLAARPECIAAEVQESVMTIRQRLGACDHMAWPFGRLEHVHLPRLHAAAATVGVTLSSGVRGRNTTASWMRRGYLLRQQLGEGSQMRDALAFTALGALQAHRER